jgi:calcineurin-like phosphoesterase family protein
MTIYFTSDFHLSHNNIIKFCHRPFINVAEMNFVILNNFFDTVKKGDMVYFLGDLSFSSEVVKKFLNEVTEEGITMNFIIGNHDKQLGGSKEIHYNRIYDIVIENQPITLCHYPMLSWNKSHFNAWNIHGHHHSNVVAEKFPGKRLDVAVDLWNFKPVSFEQVKKYMLTQPDNWDIVTDRHRRED